MNNNFAVFILTYGRPDNVVTIETLKRGGYTGKIYLLCSDDDATLDEYKSRYENVIVFNKDEVAKEFDIGDNFTKKNVVVYARNKNMEIAKSLGLKYYLQLDDDYDTIMYHVRGENKLIGRRIGRLDYIFDLFTKYLETSGATSIAFGQGGDYIGGINNQIYESIGQRRKLMNCYFNSVERPYKFFGRINEDTNCYVLNGKTGMLFITVPYVSINQCATQQNKGGLTEFYLDTGTYVKSFYTVMYNPSAVRVRQMGRNNMRLHHSVKWKNAVPVIIREKYKKVK